MMCLGFEPGTGELKAQTNPLKLKDISSTEKCSNIVFYLFWSLIGSLSQIQNHFSTFFDEIQLYGDSIY